MANYESTISLKYKNTFKDESSFEPNNVKGFYTVKA